MKLGENKSMFYSFPYGQSISINLNNTYIKIKCGIYCHFPRH